MDGDSSDDDDEEETGDNDNNNTSANLKYKHKPKTTVSFQVKGDSVEIVKRRAIDLDYPLMEEYDFRNDRINPDVPMDLKPHTRIRRYQERSLSKVSHIEKILLIYLLVSMYSVFNSLIVISFSIHNIQDVW